MDISRNDREDSSYSADYPLYTSRNDREDSSYSMDSSLYTSRNDREDSSYSMDSSLYTSRNDREASRSSAGDVNPIQRGFTRVNVKPINQADNDQDHLRIAILTWNMNSQDSAVNELQHLANVNRDHELIIIGLQDAPAGKKISRRFHLWFHQLIRKSKFGPLRLYIFGPLDHSHFTRESEIGQDHHPITPKLGKGAVGISITYKNITMNFICCHLSAHESNVNKRNAEINHISKSILTRTHRSPDLTVYFGDLNYRINGFDRKLVSLALTPISLEGLKLLTYHDQLYREAAKGEVFDGFREGIMLFNPTYKYDVGTNTYDTSSKMRKPAWTDRVLFRIEDPAKIRADVSYVSVDDVMGSSHKPVRALLHLNLNTGQSPKSRAGT